MPVSAPDVVDQVTLALGCDPEVTVTILEKTFGNLYVEITSTDPEMNLADIDGFFFDLTDDSLAGTLDIYPAPDTGVVTDFATGADSQNSLSNGATVQESHDAMVQFGTSPGSTEGHLSTVGFTIWSNSGPMTLSDINMDTLTTVVNSDGPDGQALLVKDGDGTGEDANTCSFLMEGEVNVEVTLTELENGDINVELDVLGGDDPDSTGSIGDLRGFFFDIEDESLLAEMTVEGEHVTGSEFNANSVDNLGQGNNLNGEVTNEHGDFDGGIELGTSGMSDDDIQSTSFVLSHPDGLSIEDFEGQDIGLRLTSVGEEDGARNGSVKMVGKCNQTEVICDDQYSLEDVMSLMTLTDDENSYEAPPEEQLYLDGTDGWIF